jgi:hypothetical protein
VDQYELAKKRAAYNEDNSGCTASQELILVWCIEKYILGEESNGLAS